MPARLSLAGPSSAYEYFAAKNLDGTPLLNATGAQVAIDRAQVVSDPDTGIVTVYYASPAGVATADDVTSANLNIETQATAVPGAITFSGASAAVTAVHVAGTCKIRQRDLGGLSTAAGQAAVALGITRALTAYSPTIPIGGLEQDTGGNGVIYSRDLEAAGRTGYAGIYDLKVTTPAGENTALTVGHVAALSSTPGDGQGSGDWVVSVVP
jgi:hypothetical protein